MKRISTLIFLLSIVQISNAQWVNDPMINTLAAQGQECVDPIAVADSSGNTYISYRLPNGGGYSVYMQKVDAQGYAQWGSSGKLVSDDDHTQTYTTFYATAIDPTNHAIVAWEDSRTGNADIFASRISPDSNLVWGNSGLQLSFGAAFDAAPQILPMPDSTTIIGWQSEDSTGIYLQRISRDGTRMWGLNAFLHYDHTGSAMHFYSVPRLALCNDTSFYLVFKRANASFNASQTALSINKFGLSGQTLWASNIDFQSAGAVPNFLTMNASADGNEGCIVSWMDSHGGSFYLDGFVQHIDAGGNSLLAANGQNVVAVAGSLALGNIASAQDDAGNIYAFYTTSTELYAQKIDVNGNLLFGSNGALLASTSNSFSQLNAVRTHRGFIITCAEDLVTQPSTYFAALIDTSGNLVWSTPLLPVSSITSIKSNATLTEEKNNQVVLAWQDTRSGVSTDIYVQNISVDGFLGVGMKNIQASGISIFPNPVQNSFTLKLPFAKSAEIKLFSATGQCVKLWQQNNQVSQYNVANLPEGFYFVQLTDDQGQKTFPLQIVR
ncbi:MAG: T9SS type A sorting domain-containing protein [Bacteroidia bacterium]